MRKRIPPTEEVLSRGGFCECGCGGKTTIPKTSQPRIGQYIGYPNRFIHGHNDRSGSALPHNPKPLSFRLNGYIYVWAPNHPEAQGHVSRHKKGYVLEHRLNWELANGRRLDPLEHVHHKNEIRDDNRAENLEALTPEEHSARHATGRTFTAETRAKLAETSRAAWRDGRRSKADWTPEVKAKISAGLKVYHAQRKAH